MTLYAHHAMALDPGSRLFRSVPSMQKIIVALSNSIPGVANAFGEALN